MQYHDALSSSLRPYFKGSVCEEEKEYALVLISGIAEEYREQEELLESTLRAQLIEAVEDLCLFENDLKVVTCAMECLAKILKKEKTAKEIWEERFPIGAACMALLQEDEEWHSAHIIEHDHDNQRIRVEFEAFGKSQYVNSHQIVLEKDIAEAKDGMAWDLRICAMCERSMKLTQHHLIPRKMHEKYLRKGYTREILNLCILICRPCHNAIHETEDEKALAAEYNTLSAIMGHPGIAAWVKYAKKQKSRIQPVSKVKR